jgi:7-carboxy-7-deazaguanine synthase
LKDLIRVSEIFGPTIQGEGPLIGRPTVFVRTGGCDYRCSWCDTLYAVLPSYRDEWLPMSPAEITERVDALTHSQPILVTLSGGNPAMQPLGPLIALGRSKGYSFALETQGSLAPEWLAQLEWLVISPKPPSSQMTTDWTRLDACLSAAGERPSCALKIVVFDDADYAYARTVASRYPTLPVYLQVGNPAPLRDADIGNSDMVDDRADNEDLLRRMDWLVDRVRQDRWYAARVLPQLHVLLWGNRRGV